MKKTKSERHHWWPECVSQYWKDDAGGITWLSPDGSERRLTPPNIGVIGNGHFIKLGKESGEHTPWDQNFESVFQNADSNFSQIISWLESLKREHRIGQPCRERFLPQNASDNDLFVKMIECITSLAIRSPMTRFSCISLAERFRGEIPEREKNALIAINMRDMHQRAIKSFGLRGKAAIIFSPNREFIFGDGFYHNLGTPSNTPASPRIFVPLTPRMAVLYAIPMQYTREPRISTLVVDADEAEQLNNVIQVYAKNALFFRSEKPSLLPDFLAEEHRCYSSSRNIVESMIHEMPGVPPRNPSLDLLEEIAIKKRKDN